LSDKPDCEGCKNLRALYEQKPRCEEEGSCPYLPFLMPGNEDAIFVWTSVQDQLRVAGMEGQPFAPDHNAIWMFMDKFGIKKQKEVFKKVLTLFSLSIEKMRSKDA